MIDEESDVEWPKVTAFDVYRNAYEKETSALDMFDDDVTEQEKLNSMLVSWELVKGQHRQTSRPRQGENKKRREESKRGSGRTPMKENDGGSAR